MLSPSITRNIRILEWISLIIHIVIFLNVRDKGFLSLNVLVYLIFFVISFYIPINRSYYQRQIYIYSMLMLAIAANAMNIATNFIVYIFLSKSCFLLRRRETLIITIVAGLGWALSEVYSISRFRSGDVIFDPSYGLIRNDISRILVSSLGVYTGASIFILLFCFTIVAEQMSRRKAESLSQQVEELAKALERTRIARDIHDSLGHTLTNLNVQLQLARRLLQPVSNQSVQANSDRVLQVIDLAQTLSNQCIEDVSYALASIRQVDFDLNQAVEHLVNQLRHNTHMKTTVEMLFPPLSPQISHQIYFIIKECLVNVQKHAQASQIHLRGHSSSLNICLEISDDGIGFVPKQPSDGFGLKGISERVQMLGGELEIDSVLGQGTHIQINIPL